MRILLSLTPVADRVAAMSALVTELLGRDHEVVVYGRGSERERFAASDAHFVAWQEATDAGDHEGRARDLVALIDRAGFDRLVGDHESPEVAIAGEGTGIAWIACPDAATVGTTADLVERAVPTG